MPHFICQFHLTGPPLFKFHADECMWYTQILVPEISYGSVVSGARSLPRMHLM